MVFHKKGPGGKKNTDNADPLYLCGSPWDCLPFRKAHEIVALLVRDCIETGRKTIAESTLGELKKYSKLFEEDIFRALSPKACVRARNLGGGPAPAEVRRQIKTLRRRLETNKR